jgi:hypothetical protein
MVDSMAEKLAEMTELKLVDDSVEWWVEWWAQWSVVYLAEQSADLKGRMKVA